MEFLIGGKLSLPTLADAYLEISRSLYGLLADYPNELGELRKGYRDLLKLIKFVQEKDTELSNDGDQNDKWRDSIWKNKDQALNNIALYISIMQDLKESRVNLIFGIIALIISVASLILSILSLVISL